MSLSQSFLKRATITEDPDDDESFPQKITPDKMLYVSALQNEVPRLISFYLSGEIRASEYYTTVFHVFRTANPQDIIKIHINSIGGDLDTTIQFIRVLSESNAHVIASIEGECCSAATLIMLIADEVEITPFSTFLFHNYSSGLVGKGSELLDQVTHYQQWALDLFHSMYDNFLTPTEFEDMLKGKDIWMSPDEVTKRLEKRNKSKKDKGLKKV